jgi:integrase
MDTSRQFSEVSTAKRVREILSTRWESAGKTEEGRVWPAPTKQGHVWHDSIRVQHRHAIEKSKVKKFVVYSLRHTFLTRLGESGCDAWTLARIAGHSSTKISERYVHPSGEAVLSAFARMPLQKAVEGAAESDDAEERGAEIEFSI